MVPPSFGFSVGDFIPGARILIGVIEILKEAGGASSRYTSQVLFLNNFKSTLGNLDKYVRDTPQDELSQEIAKLLADIRGPWDKFQKFLNKYDSAVSPASTKWNLGKTPRKLQYVLKEVLGEIEKLHRQIEQPLMAVNSLLLLRVLSSLQKPPDQPLNCERCTQLVDAVQLSNIISAELKKNIQTLQQSADHNDTKQDQQLEVMRTVHAQLDDRITSLRAQLDDIRDKLSSDPCASKEDHNKQLSVSYDIKEDIGRILAHLETREDPLETVIKHQRSTLEPFCEEDTVFSSDSKISDVNEGEEKWPSTLLSSTPYLVSLAVSSVVSTVTATSVVSRRSPQNYQEPQRSQSYPISPLSEFQGPNGDSISSHLQRGYYTPSYFAGDNGRGGCIKPLQTDSANSSTASEWLHDWSTFDEASQRDVYCFNSHFGPMLSALYTHCINCAYKLDRDLPNDES